MTNPSMGDSHLKMSASNSRMNPTTLKLMLDNGVDPNMVDHKGKTALMKLKNNLHKEDVRTCIDVLLQHGADPNIIDHEGKTALMHFVNYSRQISFPTKEIVEKLLQYGADPNVTDHAGRTALMHFKDSNYASSVMPCLIAAGADINHRTPQGKTLLLRYLASDNTYDIALKVLEIIGIESLINIPDDRGCHPLKQVVLNYKTNEFKDSYEFEECFNVIQTLLEKGADPNLPDEHGETPLMGWVKISNICWNEKIVELMLAHGGDPDQADQLGRTALMYAAKNNNYKSVKFLLNQTSNPNACCRRGYSCLEYALLNRKWRFSKVVPALVEGGVNVNGNRGVAIHSLNLLGKIIAIGNVDYAIQLLLRGARINNSTLKTLKIQPRTLLENIHQIDKLSPQEKCFIDLVRVEPELVQSALACENSIKDAQLRQIVDEVSSAVYSSELFHQRADLVSVVESSDDTQMTTMVQLQKMNKEKGVTIVARGTMFTDEFVLHKIIEKPNSTLGDSIIENVKNELSSRFLEENIDVQKDMADYMGFSFEEYKSQVTSETEIFIKNSKDLGLILIDKQSLFKGLISTKSNFLDYLLDLKIKERKTDQLWSEFFSSFISDRLKNIIFNQIIDNIGEFDDVDDNYIGWINHYVMDDINDGYDENIISYYLLEATDSLYRSTHSYNSTSLENSTYLENFLAPVLKNYTEWKLWVAARDETYFSIGRPDFFPILAGERVDGSYEITIFEGVNEI